jgi:type-F conjugative transfer system secretin TraK
MYRLTIWLLLALSTCASFASQVKGVSHTERVNIELSAVDPNVISASNDRINKVTVMKGLVNSSIDQNTGELIIKPNYMAGGKPFSMILSTEKGMRYTILAVPKKIPAQDVILKNKDIVLNIKKNLENKYSYDISDLIKNMVKGESVRGYSLRENKDYPKDRELKLTHTYVGDKYKGEIFILTNSTNKNLKLKETSFFGTNVLAISLGKEQLSPKESVKIYRVVKNG